MGKLIKNNRCDFYAVLGAGKDVQRVCTLTYRHRVKCDGCIDKCHCPKKAEKARQAIIKRLNLKAKGN